MTPDLRTGYLGLTLKNPVVISACPLTERIDTLQKLEEHGAAAAVFPSLFEEQIEREEMELHGLYETGAETYGESLSYFPDMVDYNAGSTNYLRMLELAVQSVGIPIIGSLNGVSRGGWVRFARSIEDAGAAALELNVYGIFPDPARTAAHVEAELVDLVTAVRERISIPLAVKLPPFFTAFANLATRLADAGADGLVLFNRFVHADIDLDTLRVAPNLVLSEPFESRLPLMWVALLRGRVSASLAATSGVHAPADVVKLLLSGADVTMTASAIYRRGPEHVRTLVSGLSAWMTENEYDSVEQMKGSLSHAHAPDPGVFERVGYMRTLASFSRWMP